MSRKHVHSRRGRGGRRVHSIALSGAVLAVSSPLWVQGQIASLDKGHSYLVNNGLFLSGWDTDATYQFNYTNITGLNCNAVIWGPSQSNAGTALMAAGQKWGKVADYTGTPSTALNGDSHTTDLVAIQVGDEQQTDIESPNSLTTAWFQSAHSQGLFTNQLLFVNSNFINSDTAYAGKSVVLGAEIGDVCNGREVLLVRRRIGLCKGLPTGGDCVGIARGILADHDAGVGAVTDQMSNCRLEISHLPQSFLVIVVIGLIGRVLVAGDEEAGVSAAQSE